MALSFVGFASASATSVTLPTFVAGDLAIVFAYRDGNVTAPSLPSGWTNKVSSGADANSFRVGYRVLTGTDTTTGVWTNATELEVLVLRGQRTTSPIGADGFVASGNSNTIQYTAPITLDVTDGTSWVVGMAGHRTATNVKDGSASGMTNRSSGGSVTTLSAHTELVSSWASSKTFGVNATSRWRSYLLEVVAEQPALTATAVVGLDAGETPTVRTGHTLTVRARKTSAAVTGTLRLQLYDGTTAIGSVLETAALTTTLTDYPFTLSEADAGTIASYADLRVHLYGYSAAGDATVFEVAQVAFVMPGAAAGTAYGAATASFVFDAYSNGAVVASGDKATATFEVSLASGVEPATRTGHALIVRARKTNGAHTGTIRAQLFEGTTARSTEVESGALTTSLDSYTLSIADVDAATITDYTALSARVRGYASTGDATVFEVASVALSLPAAGVGDTVEGAAAITSTATVTANAVAAVYPSESVYPYPLITVSSTATVTAASDPVAVFGQALLASTATVVAGGAAPPTDITALMVLPSTVTITVAGATVGDAIGQATLDTTVAVTVDGYQDSTADAAINSTVTVTVGGDSTLPPAPPGFFDTLPHLPDLLVAVAFDSQPLEPVQAYEGVTDYLRNASMKRGRQFELDRTEAGTANLLLSNLDGRFNPENPASPYYPNLKPTRRTRIQAAWDSVIYTLYTGHLEGHPQEFPNVGFDRVVKQDAVDLFMALALARFIPGSAILTSTMVTPDHNQDSTDKVKEMIDITSTALPMPQTVPFEIVLDKDRVYAETVTVLEIRSGTTYFVERDPVAATGHTPGATVTTQAVSFAQQYTGQRIQSVLSLLNLQVETDIDTGVSLLAASTDVAGTAPVGHLQEAAEAEQGRLFVSTDGKLTFHSRHRFYLDEQTNRAVFGDAGGTELSYSDVAVTHDDEKLFNIIRVTPASGNTQEARDNASIDDHFERPLELSWQLADDNEALAAAQHLLSRLSRMQVRIPNLGLDGAMAPDDLWPVILNLEIGQRYGFKLRPRDGTQMIDKTLVVEGIGHSLNPNLLTTSLQMSLADTGTYWQLNISELDTETILAY